MPKRTSDFREDLLSGLADPQEAAEYLNAALEDSQQMVLVALRDVADALQMASVAEDAGVAREALYRMLSATGNPTFANFMAILRAVGLNIVFTAAGDTTAGMEKANQPYALSEGIGGSLAGILSTTGASGFQTAAAGEITGLIGRAIRKPPAIEQSGCLGAMSSGSHSRGAVLTR